MVFGRGSGCSAEVDPCDVPGRGALGGADPQGRPSPNRGRDMTAAPRANPATGQLAQANLFTVTGPIAINYSRSSIAGVPLFSYQDAQLDLQFSGPQIHRTETPIGELVTVRLGGVIDAFE